MQPEQPAKPCALGNPTVRGWKEWEQADAITIKIDEAFLVLNSIWLAAPDSASPTAAQNTLKRKEKMTNSYQYRA